MENRQTGEMSRLGEMNAPRKIVGLEKMGRLGKIDRLREMVRLGKMFPPYPSKVGGKPAQVHESKRSFDLFATWKNESHE